MSLTWPGTEEELENKLKMNFKRGNIQKNKGNISLCYTTEDGIKINYFGPKTKTVSIQPNNSKFQAILEALLTSETYIDEIGNKIFIVHGHDMKVKESLENILYKWGLKPYTIIDDSGNGQTIIEKLEEETKSCAFGIVILTPDDAGYAIKDGEGAIHKRARQNVILEMGMLLAFMGREKVSILRHEDVEMPSDISGVIYIPFRNSLDEAKEKLRKNLKNANVKIDD